MELGTKVKCTLTGISGVIVARTAYLHSTARIAIPEPETKKNEWVWLEEQQVEAVE